MASIDTIIFSTRNKLQFYTGGQILNYVLPPTVVKDLDVLDREAFKTGVLEFMNKSSIKPGTTAILLSESVCFISEPLLKKQKPDEALNAFLATIPLESPTAMILGDKIVGTNKDLYQALNEVIGSAGGRVKMVSPSFLSKDMLGKKEFDITMAKFVVNNEESFIKATFIYEAPLPIVKEAPTQSPQIAPPNNKRMIILVSVFFGLLLLLIVIWALTRLR